MRTQPSRRPALAVLILILCASSGLSATTHYVSLSGSHVPPYTNWSTAAHSIQAALDVCATGDVVMVTNGLYEATELQPTVSDHLTVASVSNGVHLLSVNGSGVTTIRGRYNVSCAAAKDGATIEGFTLTQSTWTTGVTLERANLVRCVVSRIAEGTSVVAMESVIDHSAIVYARLIHPADAAGVWCSDSLLRNSIIGGNYTRWGGGGGLLAFDSFLENCSVVGNVSYSTPAGASLTGGIGVNCIGEGNRNETFIGAPPLSYITNFVGDFIYSCAPELVSGIGNIVGPSLLDSGNDRFTFATNSPAMNTGTNLQWMVGALDYDGNPRILQATVDMGANEALFDPVDLSLAVQHPVVPVYAGDRHRVAIVVSNAGPGDATSVLLSGQVTGRVSFVDAVMSTGSVRQVAPPWVYFSLGYIPAGGSVTITADFLSAFSGTMAESWSVDATGPDVDTSNNSFGVTNVILASQPTDLACLVRQPLAAAAIINELMSMVFVVTNGGQNAAGGTIVDVVLPQGIGFVYAATAQGTWSTPANSLHFDLGGVPSGHVVQLHVGVRAIGTGVFTTRVSVASGVADTNVADNAFEIVTLIRGPDVGVTLVSNGVQTVVATVTGYGLQDSSNLVVRLSGPLTFFDANAGVGSLQLNGSNLVWSIPAMQVGASASVTSKFAAHPLLSSVQVNASVTASTLDENLSNNQASSTFDISGADVGLTMISDSNRTVIATIIGNGPGAASNVTVALSGPVTFVKAASTGGAIQLAGPNLIWSVPVLAAGASATLTAQVATIYGPDWLTVSGSVSSTTADRNPLNDRSSAPLRISAYVNPVLSGSVDYDTKTDYIAYFRGQWLILLGPGWWGDSRLDSFKLGGVGAIPVPAGYRLLGPGSPSVFYQRNALWTGAYSENAVVLGDRGSVPVPADYDGDVAADLATYLNGTWKILLSSGGSQTYAFGNNAMIPVPADYDGDGKSDIAVFSRVDGMWWWIRSVDGQVRSANWGWNEVVPVPGDYDGDEIADLAVYYPAQGMWYINRTHLGPITIQYGWPEAFPVPNDYDGDRRTDIAVHHAGGATWYVLQSSNQQTITKTLGNRNFRPAHLQYQINKLYRIVP